MNFKLKAMKKLEYYGGQGFGYSKEDGHFEVKSNRGLKVFNKLSEAKSYYESLRCEKSIWEHTPAPELLECHTFIN